MNQEWSAKAAWMRTVGATDAAWATDGQLVHLRLGAAPVSEGQEETQQTKTGPAEAERRQREERRRVAALATGGPVRRLNETG